MNLRKSHQRLEIVEDAAGTTTADGGNDWKVANDPTSTELERKKTFWKQAGWVSLSLLVIPPLVGIIGTIIAMTKAFAAMADHGIGDPEKLAAAIGEALIATAVGVFFALPAFVFLIISIIRFRSYRARIRKQPT